MESTTTPAALLEALADENRLAIVRLLADGERCVCEVSETLGISNALASHHLKRLRDAGLVSTARKGVWLHCSLDRGALLSIAESLRSLAELPEIGSCCCAGPVLAKEDAEDV